MHLTYKAKLVHVPQMFEAAPLPLHLFVYAYEDVLYCNKLYKAQRQALQSRGLSELNRALSIGRAPPRALPVSDTAYLQPSTIAIALVHGP